MGRGVGSVGLSAESKRTPAEVRRNRMRCGSGAPFWFCLVSAREGHLRPRGIPTRVMSARPFCRAAALRRVQRRLGLFLCGTLWAVPYNGYGARFPTEGLGAKAFVRGHASRCQSLLGSFFCEAPLDGTRTFDWRLTVQARVIPRVVFYGLPCCLSWSHVALGMGPAK